MDDIEKQRIRKRAVDTPSCSAIVTNPRYKFLLLGLVFIALLYLTYPTKSAMKHTDRLVVPKEHSKLKNIDSYSNVTSKWDKYVFALKTGKDVALTRTPIQMLTFLAPIKNLLLIGEAPGVTVGPYEMIDVYSHLYDKPGISIPIANNKVKRALDKELIPDEDSLGWKADAHKNMPGYREMYKKYPDADWYIMLDDDTFVFLDNLYDHLATYDPKLPYYFGNSNVFMGCDGVTKFGDGPNFAHGGSGIVVSRGALLKILPILDKCIIKYKDCWAGDIRLGLCLRDAGVLITGDRSFNRDPPHQKYGFPSDACDRPSTFHHLLIDQIQSLYDLDYRLSKENKKTNFEQIFQHWHAKNDGKITVGNRPGQDYDNFASESAEECRDKCKNDEKCRSFAFANKRCWLKNGIPGLNDEDKVSRSGHFSSHYKCANKGSST